MKRLLFALLLCLAPAAAHAQLADVQGTPHATIHDNVMGGEAQITVFGQRTPFGDTLTLAEKTATGWAGIWSSELVTPFPVIDAATAINYVNGLSPYVNAAIRNRFAIPETGPRPTGQKQVDLVNQALYTSFKFKLLPDGTTVFIAN